MHRRIEEVASVWARLQTGGHLTAYQRLDWAASIATHFVGWSADRLLVVEIVDERRGETVLLCPLALRRRFGLIVVEWLDFGICDYAAPVIAAGTALSAAEAAEVWATIVSLLPPVDLIDIRKIPAQVDGVPNPLVLLPNCRETALEAFGLPLDGDPATLIRRLLGSKTCRNLQRRLRGMSERGAVRLVEPTSAADVESLFATMLDQRRRRFREVGRVEILNIPAVEAFYRDMALRSLRSGGPAQLFGIAVGDEIVATTYMLVHRGSMYGIILSIAGPEWSAFSPGLVMAVKMIELAAARGLTYFDMTVGSLPYKSSLGGKSQYLHRLLEPRSRAGRCAVAALLACARGKAWIVERPRLCGPLRAARQRLRRLLASNLRG